MLTEELKRILSELPRDFYGDVQIGYQAGHPGVVRVTKTHKLTTEQHDLRRGGQHEDEHHGCR